MAWNQWLNANPMAGVGAAAVVLVIAGVIAMRSISGDRANPITQRYFYNLTNGELIVMNNQPSPATTPAGAPAVWAAVFACNSCADAADRFVAHVEQYTGQAKAEALKPVEEQDFDVLQNGTLVALPPTEPGEAMNWLPVASPQGMAVMQMTHQQRCTQMPTPCTP